MDIAEGQDTTRAQESAVHEDDMNAPMHMVQELKQYLDFRQEDADRLALLREHVRPALPGLVGHFYDALEENPRTRTIFEDDAQVERLRVSLSAWLDELFGGVYDESYYAQRMRIGSVHVNVGLLPVYVFGAMNVLRRGLINAIHQSELEDTALHADSLEKLLDMELAIMLQSYWDSLFEQKLKVPLALALGLAHEIRNPLNGIGLNLTLMERRLRNLEGGEDFGPLIDVMRNEVRRIGSMTSEIMDFAKPIELRQRWVDAPNLLLSLRTLHGPTLEASRIELRTEHEGPAEVWCDPDRLQQVLTNLMTNAAEAIEQDGTVTVKVTNNPDSTVIDVIDDGQGMEPALKFRVFELFYTAKTTGTGLGLPIVRKIVEAHGGTVDLNSRVGKGTQFTLVLPRREHP